MIACAWGCIRSYSSSNRPAASSSAMRAAAAMAVSASGTSGTGRLPKKAHWLPVRQVQWPATQATSAPGTGTQSPSCAQSCPTCRVGNGGMRHVRQASAVGAQRRSPQHCASLWQQPSWRQQLMGPSETNPLSAHMVPSCMSRYAHSAVSAHSAPSTTTPLSCARASCAKGWRYPIAANARAAMTDRREQVAASRARWSKREPSMYDPRRQASRQEQLPARNARRPRGTPPYLRTTTTACGSPDLAGNSAVAGSSRSARSHRPSRRGRRIGFRGRRRRRPRPGSTSPRWPHRDRWRR
jgi:hypothetical protein